MVVKVMPYIRYGPKKSLIRISLLLLFILVCPMVSMGLDITRSTESNLAVDPGSSFYLTIPLANPESQITGSYVIISDAELKSSLETALAGSGLQIDWPNKKVGYIVRSQEMLRKSWDEQLGKLFDAVDAANLGLNLITLEPPSPTDIVTIFTGTPVDWTIDLGDNYRGTKLEGNSKAIENCMKSERDGFWITYSGGVARKSISDGILIPPTTDIIIQIPLKAPENGVEHQISLNIPYYYTTSFVKVPQCAALKITSNQVTWKKTVSVKKDKSEWTSSSGPDSADGIYYYSGVATRSKDRQAWPFKLTLIGPDTDGSINGQIEWTNLKSINQIEGSKTTTGVTFTEVAYIKRGNAILDCRYDLTLNGNSFTGTWGCLDGEQGDITVNPSRISTNYYSGVATRSRDLQAWPFKLTLIGPDTDGSINGQIEWTNLNAIHLIKGSKTASSITFTETAYIKRGNAVLNCKYYLKPDSSSFKGTWDSCGEGDYGDITMNPL